MRGCPTTIRAATPLPAQPSSACAAIHRRRFGRPVACAGVPCAARSRSADRPGFRPRARPACVVMRPALRRIPSSGGQRPSTGELRGAATGLAPDTVVRRSTPFDEGLRPSAEDRVVLRPALRRIPSPGGQRPSTGELRGAATGLAPDTVVRRSTPFDEGLRPSAEDRVVLRPALRRIPSPGGQRPSMRGCALRRRTAWYCDRPYAGYRRPAVNALR